MGLGGKWSGSGRRDKEVVKNLNWDSSLRIVIFFLQ